MKSYVVSQNDLIGKIEGVPIEIVQKMVDYQVEQGNQPDVTIFQKNPAALASEGGFNWGNTPEDIEFWIQTLEYNNFKPFFRRYSKIKYFYYGSNIEGSKVIKALEDIGGINKSNLDGSSYDFEESLYFIGEDNIICIIDFTPEALWLLRESGFVRKLV